MKNILVFIFLLCYTSVAAKPVVTRYNVDSLLKQLSKNVWIKTVLKDAATTYKKAAIKPSDISLNAFKIAFLEKAFLDSGILTSVSEKNKAQYQKANILTVVDFTKTGDKKRFITVDVGRRKVLYNTLVSHGSGTGKGSDSLRAYYHINSFNEKEKVPLFFGNSDSSARSSLGLILTTNEDYPENICHLCKYFLDSAHKCMVILDGVEAGINDSANAREIVIHTTGSRDYNDSASLAIIANKTGIEKDSMKYRSNNNCYCSRSPFDATLCYASRCGIESGHGFIGRSNGCLVLPEDVHIPIMGTIKDGSLIFIYSDAIAPTSTNYFVESPVIRQIVEYAKGMK